jgi:glycosyltransferase involved in cell wall biosynthesis
VSASVAFVQRRVPHYREAFFAGLFEHLRQREISLDVIVAGSDAHSASVEPDRPPWRSTARGRRLAIATQELIWQGVVRATAAHDLVITELSPRIISNLALIARSHRGGPKVAGFGQGRDFGSTRTPGPRSANGLLVRSVDWYFAYNDLSRAALLAQGFPPDRITTIFNTIDTRQLRDAVQDQRRRGTEDLRRSLGIAGGPVALYCGALYRGKRLDFVFDAALRLRRSFPDLALVVVGDGPCEEEVRAFAGAHDWVHYVGRVIGIERATYLATADVMLMPGRAGLVVLDSFAAGVPLVTTDLPFHGPEIGYLRHGENGWCSPNTLDAYVDAVSRLLADDELRRRLQRGCAEAAERYPLEQMVSLFSDGIIGALGHEQHLAATR